MTDQSDDFPVIDFSNFETDTQAISAEIFQAASKWGFLVLKGHGISASDVANLFSLVSLASMISIIY
jgi:isopenicillin N synthase-like dioxygenase